MLKRSIYSNIVPQEAIIAFDDFESPEALANYVKNLALDDLALQQHLQWRLDYDVESFDSVEDCICRICAWSMNSKNFDTLKKLDVEKWWNDQSHCERNYCRKRHLYRA